MDHQYVEEKFIDLLEEKLSLGEREEIQKHLDSCPRCATALLQYQTIVELEHAAAVQTPQLERDLSEAVLRSIAQCKTLGQRLREHCSRLLNPKLFVPAAALATACLALMLISTQPPYGLKKISVLAPQAADMAEEQTSAEPVPVPEQAAVPEPAPSVTLLPSENDAEKIELARTSGTLAQEPDAQQQAGESDTASVEDLSGRPQSSVKPASSGTSSDAVLYTPDPQTGRQTRYVLKNGKWFREQEQPAATALPLSPGVPMSKASADALSSGAKDKSAGQMFEFSKTVRIPAGYQQLNIPAARQNIHARLQPGSLINLTWLYKEGSALRRAVIGRNLKITGLTKASASTLSITLVVSNSDAEKLRYAIPRGAFYVDLAGVMDAESSVNQPNQVHLPQFE